MKGMKIFWLILAALAAVAFITSCAEPKMEDNRNTSDTPKIKRFYQSECKGDVEGAAGGVQSDSNAAMPNPLGEVIVETHHNYIKVFHKDVEYNCASDIEFRLEITGNDLLLTEVDTSNEPANCICPFDLEVSIINLTPGAEYHLVVYNEDHSIVFYDDTFVMDDCPDDWQCRQDADCYNLDLPLAGCPGSWSCEEHRCVWNCGSDPTFCESDADCPVGYYCDYVVWDESYPVDDDATQTSPHEGSATVAAHGVCVEHSFECTTDSDCYTFAVEGSVESSDNFCPGQLVPACVDGFCQYECQAIQCHQDSDCPEGYMCTFFDFVDYGFCQIPTEPDRCMSDADCAAGQRCEFVAPAYECDPNANPDCVPPQPSQWGVCVDITEPQPCASDADCPDEMHCVMYFEDGERNNICPDNDPNCMPDAYFGVCVPDDPRPNDCYEDYDCPDGYHCERNYMPCDPDDEDETYCGEDSIGVCVQDECTTNADCPVGMVCETLCGNGWCAGMCVDAPSEPTYCNDDSDCPEGEMCEYVDGPLGDCEDGMDCEPQSGYSGICVERPDDPTECWSDADCPVGFVCVPTNTDCEDDAQNCGPGAPGMCIETDPDVPHTCTSAQDCYDYDDIIVPACVGHFECIHNQCVWDCDSTP